MEDQRLFMVGSCGLVIKVTAEMFLKSIPPGYRFCPTDEELINYYLKEKALNKKLPINEIKEANIYRCHPEELTRSYKEQGTKEWYFFTPRDRKYPNGKRPNRKAGDGYWKATGADKKIFSGGQHIGDRKSLVYYEGKPPKGDKTSWIMHEFRLAEGSPCTITGQGDMRLDDCILCKIYEKPIGKKVQNANRDSTQAAVEDTTQAYDFDPATQANDSDPATQASDEDYENTPGPSTQIEETRTVNDPSSSGMMINHCNGTNYQGFDKCQYNSYNNHGFDNSQYNSYNNHGFGNSLQCSLPLYPSQTGYMATSNVANVQNPTYMATPISIKPPLLMEDNYQQFTTHEIGFGSVSSEPPSTESIWNPTWSNIDDNLGSNLTRLPNFDFDADYQLLRAYFSRPPAAVAPPQDGVSQPPLEEPTLQEDISQPPLNEHKRRRHK